MTYLRHSGEVFVRLGKCLIALVANPIARCLNGKIVDKYVDFVERI